jgi:hypothetical protein
MSLLIPTALEAATKVEARLIGENLVQHPRWAWMEGMLIRHNNYGPLRVVEVTPKKLVAFFLADESTGRCGKSIDWHGITISGSFLSQCCPDLTDPATIGCLQELVRRTHGAVTVSVVFAPFRDEEAGTTPPPYSAFAHGPWPTADRRISVGRSALEALALALKA